MASIIDFSELLASFNYVEIFGQVWLIPIALTFLIMVIITRNTQDFPILFLPVFMGLDIIGIHTTEAIRIAFITLGTLAFLISSMSIQVVSSVLSSTGKDIERLSSGGSITGFKEMTQTLKSRKVKDYKFDKGYDDYLTKVDESDKGKGENIVI